MDEQDKIVSEDDVLDFIFHTLYIHLDKNELHFENDILSPSELVLDAKQVEHLRELILSSGFVKASVGFGKAGYIYLTQNGIQLIKQYAKYSNYTATIQPTQPLQNTSNIPISTPTTIEPPSYADDEMAG